MTRPGYGAVDRQLTAPMTCSQRVRIIDFVDAGHPALLRMWEQRKRVTLQWAITLGLVELE